MDEAKLTEWLTTYLANELRIPPSTLDVDKPFTHFGLDSAALVGMIGDVEDFIGSELDPRMAYEFPTVRTFAKALAEKASDGR